jgi:hypothetical protein
MCFFTLCFGGAISISRGGGGGGDRGTRKERRGCSDAIGGGVGFIERRSGESPEYFPLLCPHAFCALNPRP